MTFSEAIEEIVRLKSNEVLTDDMLFMAMFSDLAPDLKKEKKIMRRICEDKMLSRFYLLVTASPSSRSSRANSIRLDLKDELGFSDEWIEAVMNAFLTAFHFSTPLKENSIIRAESISNENINKTQYEPPFTSTAINTSAHKNISAFKIKRGNIVTFGRYQQKVHGSKDAIKWRVLDIKGNKALLFSEYGLSNKPYNVEFKHVTWANCNLRSWLNNEFYNDAFNMQEKQVIESVRVKADINPGFKTNPGIDTVDKVFLLSISEVDRYLLSRSDRIRKATEYVKKQRVFEFNGGSMWWLRSPGSNSNAAAFVRHSGDIIENGAQVSDYNMVCPAIWVDATCFN